MPRTGRPAGELYPFCFFSRSCATGQFVFLGGTGLIGRWGAMGAMLETGVAPGGIIAKRRFDCGGFWSDSVDDGFLRRASRYRQVHYPSAASVGRLDYTQSPYHLLVPRVHRALFAGLSGFY
jgi:hypothetical protein